LSYVNVYKSNAVITRFKKWGGFVI